MCPTKTNPVISPDGPMDSRCLFIGEQPGREENARGRPFIGKSGKEFNDHYLPLAGLMRDNIRITNTLKCYTELDSSDDSFEDIKASCSQFHLRREILAQKPEIIVLMGAVSQTLAGLDNVDMNHGLPVGELDWWGHVCKTFATYHPALGLHQTERITPIRHDFINLGRYLRGEFHENVDEFPDPTYAELETVNDLISIIGHVYDSPCAMDTEAAPVETRWPEGVFCLQFSLEPGTGWLIQTRNRKLIKIYNEWMQDCTGPIIFHNGMYDLPELEKINVHVPWRRFDDTMFRAYHLQYLAQGLKVLAYRLCGMVMEEFMDVVTPYSTDIMADYVIQLSMEEWPKPEPQLVLDKNGNYKEYKPQGLTPKLKRMVGDFAKKPDPKIFTKRWSDWSDEEKLPALDKFGDMPRASIVHVPMEKVIRYACRDADATLRVRNKLIELKRNPRRPVWTAI